MNYFFIPSRAPPPLQLARRILSDDVSAMEKLQAYHFQPFGARCDYCAHSRDIDAVIKFETFQEDVEFVARTLNLTASFDTKSFPTLDFDLISISSFSGQHKTEPPRQSQR